VGLWPALTVGIADLGKGAAAVVIAYWLLAVPPLFVLLAGLAAVIGHNWMVFLKFSGGKGMGPAIGVLAMVMPLYGYWQGLLIFFGIILIPFIITRNVALSLGIGLVALPFIIWSGMHSGIGTIMAIILGLVVAIKFTPTARRALTRSKTKKEFIFDRWRREKKEEM
jgi:glycerol-3-phosphate acyltransferase PlsY